MTNEQAKGIFTKVEIKEQPTDGFLTVAVWSNKDGYKSTTATPHTQLPENSISKKTIEINFDSEEMAAAKAWAAKMGSDLARNS